MGTMVIRHLLGQEGSVWPDYEQFPRGATDRSSVTKVTVVKVGKLDPCFSFIVPPP